MDPCSKLNYSYSYREDANLCFETGSFGLKVSNSNLCVVSFGIFDENNNALSYLEALPKNASNRMNTQLIRVELFIEILLGDDTYRLVTCGERRMWESGMICQHYDFKQLTFLKMTNNDSCTNGDPFANCDSTLYILVWPDAITFTMELKFKDNNVQTKNLNLMSGFTLRMKFKDWEISQTYGANEISRKRTLKNSLQCNINDTRAQLDTNLDISCNYTFLRQEMKTDYSDHFNCYLLAKDGLIDRKFEANYTDIRDYDLFHIQVNNQSDNDKYVPILLFVQHLANPTGLCPIICDKNFEPTGIHIQLSKNWHSKVRSLNVLLQDFIFIKLFSHKNVI